MQRPLVCISWQIRALEDYFPPNTEREPDPEVEGRGRAGLLADLRYYSGSNGSDILEAYRKIPGSFLAPLAVLEGRNAFHVRTLFHCWELLTAAEAERGQRYKYWIYARLDWLWLALPPDLSVFEDADPAAVWIPDGQDWDGINDRFAIVPRKYAKPYFCRWPWLVNGSFLPMMHRATGRLPASDFYRGPEWSLLAAMHWYRVPIRRFGSTGAILCMGGRRAKYGRCTRPTNPAAFSYKYSAEVSEASATFPLIQQTFVNCWMAGPRLLRLQRTVVCVLNADVAPRCRAASCDAKCWTDVYDYGRCCLDGREGLWVLPSPEAAEAILNSGNYPFCWPIVEAVQRCLLREDLESLAEGTKRAIRAASLRLPVTSGY
ncbi:unnamed protein product [Symbiodinium pilosum]|uniref:Uncharacterized protein n=1 Tax=Symbiodinium pilosum TaxID=2952 RepID=A0A812IQN4_SYMPI|nr:unnamed protein product [Symbiodinium pilosum]